MRLGGPIFAAWQDFDEWARAHQAKGYSAAYVPKVSPDDAAACRALTAAAVAHDLVLAEVGAWGNPMSDNAAAAAKALHYAQRQLALAEAVGARCCVNIAGAIGTPRWDGPSAANYAPAAFDRIVETTRCIIDAVRPTRTFYTLECMPWMLPDGPDNYLDLLHAIDRPAFAVHLDAANLISNPRRYYRSAAFMRECVAKLGPHIRSVHLKDVRLRPDLGLPCHLQEVAPGEGELDLGVLLSELERLDPVLPVMLEHLPDEAAYDRAADHVRRLAVKNLLTTGRPGLRLDR
jgi:sugar phosphate isomerase/epimerase